MKNLLPCVLLLAGSGLMQASIVESISIDLSDLHAGSTLSGTFTLPNTPAVGDTAPVLLTFSDPSDYSVSSLMATISIGSGIMADTVSFSPLEFMNPSGNSMTTNVDLMVAGAAECASFPCTANGRFEDQDPAVFTSEYSIAPVAVPEPAYGAAILISLGGMAFRRRFIQAK